MIITPLGIAVVPVVKMISQTSSPWISTSGSVTGAPSTKPRKSVPSPTGPPPMVIVTPGATPARPKAASMRGHSSASTIAKPGSVRPSRWAMTSGASIGLIGTHVMPALAMPILHR